MVRGIVDNLEMSWMLWFERYIVVFSRRWGCPRRKCSRCDRKSVHKRRWYLSYWLQSSLVDQCHLCSCESVPKECVLHWNYHQWLDEMLGSSRVWSVLYISRLWQGVHYFCGSDMQLLWILDFFVVFTRIAVDSMDSHEEGLSTFFKRTFD